MWDVDLAFSKLTWIYNISLKRLAIIEQTVDLEIRRPINGIYKVSPPLNLVQYFASIYFMYPLSDFRLKIVKKHPIMMDL